MEKEISKSKFTILGSKGFIGSNLLASLQSKGAECATPYRDDPGLYGKNLNHVIYCIGLTANFRERPFDTIRAHVIHLMQVLENCTFDSFLYLSSTRLYLKGKIAEEASDIRVNSSDPDDLYILSKLMGESICFASSHPNVRVARLSNVFGDKKNSSDFLSSVINDAVEKGKIYLKSGLASAKDYVRVDDVVAVLPKISVFGRHRLYNVASGKNVSHQNLLDEIQNLTGCDLEIAEAAESIVFPQISIKRLQAEFKFSPTLLIPSLKTLVPQYVLRGAHD